MKKLVASLFAVSFLLMTACTSEDGGPEKTQTGAETVSVAVSGDSLPQENTAATDTMSDADMKEVPKAQKYVDMVNGQKVYFKCTIKDSVSDAVAEMAYDGNSMYMDQDYGDGMRVSMIMNEEGIFSIMHDQKMYYKMSDEAQNTVTSQEFIKSTDEYDEYKATDGSIYRYYTDENGKLVKSEVTAPDGSVMNINYMVFTDEIPEGIFDIPEGYSEEKIQ